MKKLIIIILLSILLFIFIVPPYNELNNIAIIDAIGIEKKENLYNIYLREIIPKKSDNGITYEYKMYTYKTNKSKDFLPKMQKKYKKKLYLNKTKFLITNLNSKNATAFLNININAIYHTNKVYKKTKEVK